MTQLQARLHDTSAKGCTDAQPHLAVCKLCYRIVVVYLVAG
jgi:hypothetical protein